MQTEIEMSGANILLDVPQERTESVLVFLPGVSGGARGSRYDSLVRTGLESGYAVARVDMWESEDSLMDRMLSRLSRTLTEVVEGFVVDGYTSAIMVGKSFGGGITLMFNHPIVTKKIMWAPAFSYADVGNIDALRNVPLGTVARVTDISIGKDAIAKQRMPLCIVHGTADVVVPLLNSQNIVANAPYGTLVEINGADHSFKTPEQELALMAATRQLLQ